jgi:hypothetical protein
MSSTSDRRRPALSGLPDLFWYNIPRRKKLPNYHKIYQMSIKYTALQQNIPKGPLNIPTTSIARPSKIYPNLDYWFENIPSGDPEPHHEKVCCCLVKNQN